MNSVPSSTAGPDEIPDRLPAGAPLIEVANWPAAGTEYRLGGTGTRPELTVTVSASPDAGLLGPSRAEDVAVRLAADHAERYRAIGAQLDEPGLTVCLLTSLDPSLILSVTDGAATLRRFARAAELFAQAAAAARPPALAGLTTLSELLDRYGMTAAQLAIANEDRPLNHLLAAGQPLVMRADPPEPHTVPAGSDTMAQVAGQFSWPSLLLEDNRDLRLAAEAAMTLPGIASLPAEARTPYSVRTGDTLATLARRFGSTPRDLVADNAEVAGTLQPGIRIEVSVESGTDADAGTGAALTAGTDTVAGDSFAAVRVRLAEQHAGVALDAVADALDRLGPVLGPGSVLSCPLAVLGSGRDGADPLTAGEAAADYGCPPVAFGIANAALLGLLQPGIELRWGTRTTTTTEHDTLYTVLGRLESGGWLPSTGRLESLLADLATVPLFRPGARALLPPSPSPVTLAAVAGHGLEPAELAGPLRVTLRLARNQAPRPADTMTEQADTEVPLGQSLDDLVSTCLALLPEVRLATTADGTVWAVPFGTGGISGVRIEAAAPDLPAQAFALRSLYRQPLDFTAAIRLVGGYGGLALPTQQQFSQVDVEPWARLFVTQLDQYLSEPVASGLLEGHRASLTEIRRQVAGALAGGLAPVLHGEPAANPALPNTHTALSSIGRASLGSAYLARVVARYRAVTTSPYGGDGRPAARLTGTLRVPDRPDLGPGVSRTELDPADAACTVALSCTDPAGGASVSYQPRHDIDGFELDTAGRGEPGPATLMRFARPLTDGYRDEAILADLPAAELPIPLRDLPKPVGVHPMTATATFAGPGLPTLAEAARWTSGLSYTYLPAAQDVVRLVVSDRSSESAAGPPPVPVSTALAEALADYAASAAELSRRVTPGFAPSGVPDLTQLEAADSLVTLAGAVATAWSGHWTEPAPADSASTRPDIGAGGGDATGEGRLAGDYRLRAVYTGQGTGSRLLDRLVVSRTGTGAEWPLITVNCGGGQLPLTPGPDGDGIREYRPADRPEVAAPFEVRLEWPGLRAAPDPAARVTLTVERNAMLLDGRSTAPDFVLTAAPVEVAVASPALRWDESLPLTGDDLAQSLQHAFEVLAGGQPERRATIEVGYAEPVGELQTVRPALLAEAVLTPESATQLTAQMQDWQRRVQPATAGAAWHLRFTVHSPRDGEPPLATFEQLIFPASAGEPETVES